METVEAMCESIAIVDRGRLVVGGPLRRIKRESGRRLVHLSVDGDHRLPWLAGVPGARVLRPGIDRTEVELDPGTEPETVLAAAVAAGARVSHFEVAEPSLEQIFIDHVGHGLDEDDAPAADSTVARAAASTAEDAA
jgi:ABC-2 type transport system ATP-binding protein